MQIAHHLAAVTHTERENIFTPEEQAELLARAGIEQDRLRPALPGTEHVAIGKSAASDETVETQQGNPAGNDIRHVHVDGFEPRAVECSRHFHLTIHPLLAQDRNPGARALGDKRRGDVLFGIERQSGVQSGIGDIEDAIVFLLRAFGIVAQPLQVIRRLRPCALQCHTRFAVNFLAL